MYEKSWATYSQDMRKVEFMRSLKVNFYQILIV